MTRLSPFSHSSFSQFIRQSRRSHITPSMPSFYIREFYRKSQKVKKSSKLMPSNVGLPHKNMKFNLKNSQYLPNVLLSLNRGQYPYIIMDELLNVVSNYKNVLFSIKIDDIYQALPALKLSKKKYPQFIFPNNFCCFSTSKTNSFHQKTRLFLQNLSSEYRIKDFSKESFSLITKSNKIQISMSDYYDTHFLNFSLDICVALSICKYDSNSSKKYIQKLQNFNIASHEILIKKIKNSNFDSQNHDNPLFLANIFMNPNICDFDCHDDLSNNVNYHNESKSKTFVPNFDDYNNQILSFSGFHGYCFNFPDQNKENSSINYIDNFVHFSNQIQQMLTKIHEKNFNAKIYAANGCFDLPFILILLKNGINTIPLDYCTKISDSCQFFSVDLKAIFYNQMEKKSAKYVKVDPRSSIQLQENINDDVFSRDFTPLLHGCSCYACLYFTKSYIHHLIKFKEILGFTLLAMHNLRYILDLFCFISEKNSNERINGLISLILPGYMMNSIVNE